MNGLLERIGNRTHAALILIMALALSACALTGTARHRAVVVDTGLYTAIAAVDDVEMSLSTSGAITPAQHKALNPKILAMLKTGQAANRAIQVWPQGTPAPKELAAAVVELGKVADAVVATLPDGATKSKLQTAVMNAQKIAGLLLALSPLLPGGTARASPLLIPPEALAFSERDRLNLGGWTVDAQEGALVSTESCHVLPFVDPLVAASAGRAESGKCDGVGVEQRATCSEDCFGFEFGVSHGAIIARERGVL